MSVSDENYKNDEVGRAAYDPKVLLKVMLFAYRRSIGNSHRGSVLNQSADSWFFSLVNFKTIALF